METSRLESNEMNLEVKERKSIKGKVSKVFNLNVANRKNF